MGEVTVVVPIYKSSLSENESISFKSIYEHLATNHAITIVKPNSLDVEYLITAYPKLSVESFDDAYFKSIAGYNRLMLSSSFYERFTEYKYILIAQTDCYIFKDELLAWCAKGYDYIGAPWLVRPIYRFPLFRFASWIKKIYCSVTKSPNSQVTNFKVGNGGLSLRKVSSHIRATSELADIVQSYLNPKRRSSIYNEDVFFALEPTKGGIDFSYPHYSEALRFSIDKYPELSMAINGGELPFGCHGWYKRRMIGYWRDIILK